jgi:uncharacterized protein YndB with AHSA1/START domain
MAAPPRTTAATETGCLVIADISGYTGYIVEGPLEFSEDVVADVTETIAARLGQVLRINKREGDAVFAYAFRDEADASLILDTVEACYFAFRSRLEGVSHSTTCSCSACRKATELDLKFVLHAGEWIRRDDELTGTDVIVAHRLLKNELELSAYALVTESFAAAYGLDPELLGLVPHVERYDDVGEIRGFVSDLEGRYLVERNRRRVVVSPEDAAFTVETTLTLPPAAAWELLTAPAKRLLWQVDDIEEAQAGGRRATGTACICVDGRTKIFEELLDWRPFDYFTESRTPEGGTRFLLTTSLTPEAEGTAARILGRPDGGRPGWREIRRLVRRLRADYDRLAVVATAQEEEKEV